MENALNFRKSIVLLAFLIQFFIVDCLSAPSLHTRDIVDWDDLSHSSTLIVVSGTNQTFAARPATFGPAFGNEFKGRLVRVAGDRFGCHTPLEVGINSTEYAGNIVLVQRGKCSFVDKVLNIQKRGGVAVIVGDDIFQDSLFTLYPDGIILFEGRNSHRRSKQCYYTVSIDIFGKL
jgi:hypothetical protein